jgi:hypothetical protein
VLQCPRKFALNREGRVWVTTPPLVKGSLVHVGLAHYYALQASKEGDEPLYSPREAVQVLAEREYEKTEQSMWLDFVELCQHTVDCYIAHYEGERWYPLYIEEQFRAQVSTPRMWEGTQVPRTFLFTQRADLVVRDHLGKVWIVDHKTSGRINKAANRYTLSGQFLGYQMFGRKAFKKDFGGVILNLIQHPRTCDDTPVFRRLRTEPAPWAVKTFKQTLIHAEDLIARYNDLDTMDWPAVHHETACMTPYGPCPHAETCQFG